ncbi:MAG: BtpA/SgcQ family protein [Phycisphaerales bacterium]|nr:BtpA/SgcQ family protein [Phycisphaerales bacterium]
MTQTPLPPLIGMVHVGALPGTPRATHAMADLVRTAVIEARTLVDAGFPAVLIENMHDAPYLRRTVGPEIVAGMTRIGAAVREAVDVPLGVQILAGDNRAALATALAVGATFIRAEGFVFASIADEGLLDEADAGPLLRYRRAIGAGDVRILADIKKKHSSHAVTADVDLAETAAAAAFCGADGVIVTGVATGRPTDPNDLRAVRLAYDGPLLVGSGVTPATVGPLLAHADALIVGSACKIDGRWTNPVDPARARAIVKAGEDARA